VKIAILIFVLLGFCLIVWALHVNPNDTNNPDGFEYELKFIPGVISLLVAILLTVGWGIYRLFTS
jgi:uncharacterized membrane protein